jgi:hypothetical protein
MRLNKRGELQVKSGKVQKRTRKTQPKVSTADQIAVVKSLTVALARLSEIMKCMMAAESVALSGFVCVTALAMFLRRLSIEGVAPSPAVTKLLDDLAAAWGCAAK